VNWSDSDIAASTVWEILNSAGIGPAPRRASPTWTQFLANQARGIIATDSFHLDTASAHALRPGVPRTHTTASHRRRHRTPDPGLDHPTRRNLTTDIDGPQGKLRFLLRDRDTTYSATFQGDNIDILTSTPQATRMNAHREQGQQSLGQLVQQ
jgi:putative transposase